MNYLLLFESFESNLLSKTIDFLNKKIVDKSASTNFIKSTRMLLDEYDIPINSIKDSNLEYLNKSKALRIQAPEKWKANKWNVYCIKFWFSIERGYLGSTGVGDKHMNFTKWININRIPDIKTNNKNELFNLEELRYLRDNVVKTGILKPVNDYGTLNHGDYVVGYLSESDQYKGCLVKSRIFLSDNRLYAIQNECDGSEPMDTKDWKDWGRHSWDLGQGGDAGDHRKLHHLLPSEEMLHIENNWEENDDEESPYDFNLPIDDKGQLTNWSMIDQWEDINKSDFALVLNLDEVLKTPFLKTSVTKSERISSKEGATRLLKDEDIRKINTNKYYDRVLDSMGICKNSKGFKNLQKIISKCLCDNFGMFVIYRNKPNYRLRKIRDDIANYLLSYDSDDQLPEWVKEKLRHEYIEICEERKKSLLKFKKDLDYIENYGNEQQKEFTEIALRCGSKLQEYVNSQKINTVDDLIKVYNKIEPIDKMYDKHQFKLNYAQVILNCLGDGIDYHIHMIREFDLTEDIKKIKLYENYIDLVI